MINDKIDAQTKEELNNMILEIERLNEKKSQIQEEIKEVFSSAKLKGFDVKAMKEVIKLRKIDKQKMIHEEDMREFYKDILIEL